MKKFAVYKCLIGNYDILLNENQSHDEIDYFLFTDNPNLNIFPYKTILVNKNKTSSAIANRFYKIKIPEVLHNYAATMYLDSNISIVGNVLGLMKNFLKSNAEIGLFMHPYHTSQAEDIDLCIKNNKCNISKLNEELNFYKSIEYKEPENFSDNSVLIRKKYNFKLEAAMNEWYDLVDRYSGRDQISLPIIRSIHGLDDYFHEFSPRNRANGYFLIFPHKRSLFYDSFFDVLKFYLKFIVKIFQKKYMYYSGSLRNGIKK